MSRIKKIPRYSEKDIPAPDHSKINEKPKKEEPDNQPRGNFDLKRIRQNIEKNQRKFKGEWK